MRRIPGGEIDLLVWAVRKPIPLAEALGWFPAEDRPGMDQWCRARLDRTEAEPDLQGITLRAVAGPLTGSLIRFVADPGPPVLGPAPGQVQVSGFYIDFLSQLAPLRQALSFIELPRLSSWVLDVPSGRLDMDAAWFAMLGRSPPVDAPFTHQDWLDLTHPEDGAAYDSDEIRDRLRRGEVVEFVSRSRHADGRWIWLFSSSRGAFWSPKGEILRIIGYDIDVTEHRELQARTEDQRLLMQRILDTMPSGQLVVDTEGRITFLNPVASEILALAPGQAEGRAFLDLIPLETGAEALRAAVEGRSPLRNFACVMRRTAESGQEAAVRQLMSERPLPDSPSRRHLTISTNHEAPNGKTFITINDETAQVLARRNLEQAVEQARYIATHDLMTGLPDRYDFLRHLSEVLQEAEAQRQSFAVMMIDLDDFKMVNDGMGHEVGDQLLKAAATRLARGLPDRARLARFGGDEFVLLVPDCAAAEAALLADELRGRFSTPLDFSRRNSTISCSIGIGIHPHDARSAEALLRAADLAMYEAKSIGRGQIRRYSPELGQRNERRNAVRHALQRALKGDGFSIALQPKFDLMNQSLPIGAEVLLRLTDPEMGQISPVEFIPVAETHDLISAIDRAMVRLVQALRRGWKARGIELPLSINLSAVTLSSSGFGDLMDALAGLVEGGGLVVEVTETSLMGRLADVHSTLNLLRAEGVGVAVDDFGIGHSSLAYLQSLPIRELKIDRSFVSGLGLREASPSQAIVRAILAMADAMGLDTVAEGIETTEQANWLIDHGCTQAQGYLLGQPVPPEQFVELYLSSTIWGPGSPAPEDATIAEDAAE